MSKSKSASPRLEPRLRFPHDGPSAFGPGKARLLREIDRTGSLRTAAEAMAMSYNRAWQLVRQMNGLFVEPLVTLARGGARRGGATLTPLGRDVLARYTRMEKATLAATRRDWQALTKLLQD